MHFANPGEPTLIVILSDINMPGMDGLQLVEAIKKAISRHARDDGDRLGDDERRRRAGALGVVEFITKPVDLDALKAQLRQLPSAAD